jgi:hypothetical protein
MAEYAPSNEPATLEANKPSTPVQPAPASGPYVYQKHIFQVDWRDVLLRAIKYILEGLAVAIVAYFFIGHGKLTVGDVIILGITAAFVFAILDAFSPMVSLGVRFGAGFGIGQGLFNVAPNFMGQIAGPAGLAAL